MFSSLLATARSKGKVVPVPPQRTTTETKGRTVRSTEVVPLLRYSLQPLISRKMQPLAENIKGFLGEDFSLYTTRNLSILRTNVQTRFMQFKKHHLIGVSFESKIGLPHADDDTEL